jgi:hypothetical protein
VLGIRPSALIRYRVPGARYLETWLFLSCILHPYLNRALPDYCFVKI